MEAIASWVSLEISETDQTHAQEILQKNKVLSDYVVLHMFAGWEPKEWPPERFAQIAEHLFKKYRLQSVLIGTEKEVSKI